MPLEGDALDPRHALVLDAHRQSGGRISPELFGMLDDLGVNGLTSIYDPSVRVVSIGGGIDFWDQSRRQGVAGQSLMALPGPRDYLAAAHNALTDAAGGPQHHRMRVVADGNVAVFRRLALDFPGSALRLGITVVESIEHASL
ncbi:hypothetical protein Y958_11530 [Nitrospirillum viridazoti CBAmc]|uniref:Uncharacterized protein n=1 Tax=Nitrospirillum viridazoti CBAmc TaxID=1441467 RepID=A0A248JRQ8_9PROT|nr:hypothetical protein Y958_11530 [Nitrospirillum amazonense CBAmc]